MEIKVGFFQFEIIINFLVCSFRFIWMPMLWVHGRYKYFNSFSVQTVFIHQNLMYKNGSRAEKIERSLTKVNVTCIQCT